MKTRALSQSIHQRGLVITDCVVGLGILMTLLTITAITVGYDQRATRAAAEHRQLTFEAESALIALQANQPPPAPANPSIKLTYVVLEDRPVPDSYLWLNITADDGKQSSEIIGLVPSVAENMLIEKGLLP
ncbi:MAG: hypothetical protein AAGI37_14530 [Planctomycetota bacterium]